VNHQGDFINCSCNDIELKQEVLKDQLGSNIHAVKVDGGTLTQTKLHIRPNNFCLT